MTAISNIFFVVLIWMPLFDVTTQTGIHYFLLHKITGVSLIGRKFMAPISEHHHLAANTECYSRVRLFEFSSSSEICKTLWSTAPLNFKQHEHQFNTSRQYRHCQHAWLPGRHFCCWVAIIKTQQCLSIFNQIQHVIRLRRVYINQFSIVCCNLFCN